MTHTVQDVRTENWGSQMVEVQEVNITSLDSAGSESGISPGRLNEADGFVGHAEEGTGEFVSYDETNGALKILDNTGAQVTSGTDVGVVRCVWFGSR
jgi:hypothetical protein